MKINTLIVDDEPLARERIRTLLETETDFELTGEAANGKEALQLVLDETIDLIFLDIQMPELDGVRLVEKIPAEKLPLVIFTTAYDAFAVKAFELNAVDYLLKPFTKKRFQQALDRIREEFRSDDRDIHSSAVMTALQQIIHKKQYPERLAVKSEGKIRFVPIENILWAESNANYITLHTDAESVAMRETMANLVQRLDPSLFIRTHRSVMVNVQFIKELKPWFNDELVIILHNGTQLPVGKTYRKAVMKFIRQ